MTQKSVIKKRFPIKLLVEKVLKQRTIFNVEIAIKYQAKKYHKFEFQTCKTNLLST